MKTILDEIKKDYNLDNIIELINKGADVNYVGYLGETALIYSAKKGLKDIVELLIAEPDKTLQITGSVNLEESLITLINKANINAKDNYGCTALMRASALGHADIVKILIDNGADVSITNNHFMTALIQATENRHYSIVNLLVQKMSYFDDRDCYGCTALMKASSNGDISIVNLLISKGANVNIIDNCGNSSLSRGASCGFEEVVKLLLDHHAIPNAINGNKSPLICAGVKGNINIITMLIEKNADINYYDKNNVTALMEASWNGQLEAVKCLVENGALINTNNKLTPLMCAADRNHVHIVEYLINNGAAVNYKDDNGMNSLLRIVNKNFFFDEIINHTRNYNEVYWSIINKKIAITKLFLMNETNIDLVHEGISITKLIKDDNLASKLIPFINLYLAVKKIIHNETLIREDEEILTCEDNEIELLYFSSSIIEKLLTRHIAERSSKLAQKCEDGIFNYTTLEGLRNSSNEKIVSGLIEKIFSYKADIVMAKSTSVYEEIEQIERLIITAFIYRQNGDKEKNILTYSAAEKALEFYKDQSDKDKSKYQEILSIYDSEPYFKKTGYLLECLIEDNIRLKELMMLFTETDKESFVIHINNICDTTINILPYDFINNITLSFSEVGSINEAIDE